METKANYTLVGFFTLVVMVAAFVFVYWMATFGRSGEMAQLEIRIPGSASGLSVGAPVLFNGIRIGSVRSLTIDGVDPNFVLAMTEVRATAPVYETTKAKLGIQGLTGQSHIDLSAGGAGGVNILEEAAKKGSFAVLTADESSVTNLLATAEDIMARVSKAVTGVEEFVETAKGPLTETVNNAERFSAALAEKPAAAGAAQADQTPWQALAEARRHKGYLLLTAGFFVCGFQTLFIAQHLPPLLLDNGLSAAVGATAISLIGLFNVIGCVGAGVLGNRYSKKNLLSLIYFGRAVVMTGFFLFPMTHFTVVVFSSLIGLLFLSTIPLTSGIVAQVFGTRYMAMLYGIVFLDHQIGSFIGIWLGGVLFDYTGSYDMIWWTAVGLGVAAAIIHWPIDERAIPRAVPAAAAGTSSP